MTLLDQDWTEEQAQGLLDSLNLDGGTPKWKLEHLRRLHDWYSAQVRTRRQSMANWNLPPMSFAMASKLWAWLSSEQRPSKKLEK
jgi:hypothetical protein